MGPAGTGQNFGFTKCDVNNIGPKLTFPQDYSAWNLSNQDLGMCIPVKSILVYFCDNQTTETSIGFASIGGWD